MHVFKYSVLAVLLCLAPALAADGRQGTTSASATNAPAPAKKLSLDEFEAMLKEGRAKVMDIRTPREFAAGHIRGATNVDWNSTNFAENVARLDKSQPWIVHCQSGNRSGRAMPKLQALGFRQLYEFSGGMRAWNAAGKPVEK